MHEKLIAAGVNPDNLTTDWMRNSPRYREYLKTNQYDPRVTEGDFETMNAWAEDPEFVDNEDMHRLFDRYSMQAPSLLHRGEGLIGESARFSAPGPIVEGFASASMNPYTARNFAGGHSSNIATNFDDEPFMQRRGLLARLKAAAPYQVLPIPTSGESEFVIRPGTSKQLIAEKPDTADDLLRRLYLLKKRGGAVHALR
jgi:hypothetical protein